MPYIRCPECKQGFHLNVADIEDWLKSAKEKHPEWDGKGSPPIKCYKCWKEENESKEKGS